MGETSPESIIMTLLGQVRCLEDERDKALELCKSLNEKLSSKVEGGNENTRSTSSSPNGNFECTLETLAEELEEVRLNEEQRQFNISEISKVKKGSGGSEKSMVDMCKEHYGKMISELQQERKSLQNKVEVLENKVIEKDMQIAELKLSVGKRG